MTASTISPCRGSPFAAELDRKLAGTEPLLDVINWYGELFKGSGRNERLRLYKGGCSGNESAALYLSFEGYESEAELATRPCECIHRCEDVCKCFNRLKAARAAFAHAPPPAKAAVPDRADDLTDDIEGFEMQVDRVRRYAVVAIRDQSVQGDRAAVVESGRKLFLSICEQGIKAAEQVGNHAYTAMLQRQREKFCRALSDQAAPNAGGIWPVAFTSNRFRRSHTRHACA
jgi:hypothetical protein